jgi:hypothetical protein
MPFVVYTQAHLYTARRKCQSKEEAKLARCRRNCCILVSAHCAPRPHVILLYTICYMQLVQRSSLCCCVASRWKSAMGRVPLTKRIYKSDEQVLFRSFTTTVGTARWAASFFQTISVCAAPCAGRQNKKLARPHSANFSKSNFTWLVWVSTHRTSGHQNPMFV